MRSLQAAGSIYVSIHPSICPFTYQLSLTLFCISLYIHLDFWVWTFGLWLASADFSHYNSLQLPTGMRPLLALWMPRILNYCCIWNYPGEILKILMPGCLGCILLYQPVWGWSQASQYLKHFLSPVLLRNNWHTSLYKFKVYSMMVWFTCIVKWLP